MGRGDPLELVGTVVRDAYEVVELVSEGGLSLVYRLRHVEQGAMAALKCYVGFADLPPESAGYLRANFVKVGRIIGRLAMYEEGLARTFGLGSLPVAEDAEVPCAILEWLEGETLEAFLDRERTRRLVVRSPEEVLELLDQPIRALSITHEHGVVHRDLKPSNFFVCGSSLERGATMKILDFSLAKIAGSHPPHDGVTFMTPNYAAPEQFWGDEAGIGPWTDVFSLALIMIELMLGGRPALKGEDFEVLRQRSEDPGERPTPRSHGLEVSNAIEAVFKRALSVDPWERFPTVGRFAEALRAAIESDGRVTSSGISRICGVIDVPSSRPPVPPAATRAAPSQPEPRRTSEGTVIAAAPMQLQAVITGDTVVSPMPMPDTASYPGTST